MDSLTLQLPVPSPKLRSNGSFGSRYVYFAAFRAAKALAKAEAQRVLADAKAQPPRWIKAGYVATLYHTTPQRMDPGNLIASLKAYEDGIAAAGIIVNDKHLYPGTPQFVRAERMPRVEITITPIYV